MCLLKKSEGQAVSKDVLTREVYKREWNTEDRLVDNIISKLRKKLNSAGSEAAIITVRNRGYILQQGFFNQSE